jgi:coenzyme F420-reducing hydrogenase gamma subunit
MKKLKIAIFDMTDCEGCELEFINLREKLAQIAEQTDIANWRFASHNKNLGPFDVTFVEGSPITENDIESVKQARAVSRLIVSLGSCAELGGIQASLGDKEWKKGLEEVYGKGYKTKSKPPKPLSYYINVDIHLPGCPINQNELSVFLTALVSGKTPIEARFPVCLECKARDNNCLLLDGEACLGPVTKGGCEAACPSRGLRCWGCFGALAGGNQQAMKNLFDSKYGKLKTKELLRTFYSQQTEYKILYPKDEEMK